MLPDQGIKGESCRPREQTGQLTATCTGMPYWLKLFGDTVDETGAIALSSGRDSLITSILSAG